jgi:hypothetical protein
MTPRQVDELGDDDFAAMLRVMSAEAEAIKRASETRH